MGCNVSQPNRVDEVDIFDSKIKYYKNQSIGSFNREIIMCGGCNKYFNIGSNQIK